MRLKKFQTKQSVPPLKKFKKKENTVEDDDFSLLCPALSILEKYSGKPQSPVPDQWARERENLFRIRI